MGIITQILSLYDSPKETMSAVKENPKIVRQFILALILGFAIYGLVHGFLLEKNLVEGAKTGLWLLFKIPLALVLTVLFSFPTIYIISRAFGGRLSGVNILSNLFISASSTSLVALAILPLNVLYTLTGHSPVTLHVLLIFLLMIVAVIYLFKGYEILGDLSKGRVYLITLISAIILLFVLIQFVDLLFEITTAHPRGGVIGTIAYTAVEKASLFR